MRMLTTCLMRGFKFAVLGAAGAALAWMTGCAEMDNYMAAANTMGRSQGSIYSNQTEPYNGPKARVAVMDFQDKTAQGRGAIGNGMKEQLVTALGQTGAFILLERDNLNDVMREQNLGASGRANPDTAAPIGGVEGADFLIYGAVTEYMADQAGVNVNGSGEREMQNGNLLQAAAGAAMNQSHVAIDLRVVDSKTARIVATTTIQGRARDLGGGLDGQFSGVLLGANGHYNTPIEKAVRACMIKASNWIADNTLRSGVVHTNETQADGPYSRRPEGDRRGGGDSYGRSGRDDRGGDRYGRQGDRGDDRGGRSIREGDRPERRGPAASLPVGDRPGMRQPARPRTPIQPQTPAAAQAQPQTGGLGAPMTVVAPNVLVHSNPSTGSPVVGKLTLNQQVTVVETQNGWKRMRMDNGLLGWVHGSALK